MAHIRPGMLAIHVRVTIAADPVPVFPAQHLIDRNAVRFTSQIPQGDLQPADAAALAGWPPKLLHPPKKLFHITGIFPQDAAFQHLCKDAIAAVPDFAETDNALIGINLHQSTVHGGPDDVCETDICNFQITWKGIAIHR